MSETPDLMPQLSPAQTGGRDEVIEALDAVLRNSHGRRVLLWLLESCNIYGLQFTGEDAATNFNLGKRDIGLRLIAKMNELSALAYPNLMLSQLRDAAGKKEDVNVLDQG